MLSSLNLTGPTVETYKEYAAKRFEKLNRYLPKFDGTHAVRISVKKERHIFVVQVEIAVPKVLVVKVRAEDLRRAIDEAYAVIKSSLLKYREKVHQRRNPVT